MVTASAIAPEASRVDTEFSRAWMTANPDLFVKNMLDFLDRHPVEAWERRVSNRFWYVTLTAIRKDGDATATRSAA